MGEIYLDLAKYMDMGGPVLPFIALLTCLMWTLIFERIWYFYKEHGTFLLTATTRWESRAERNSWTAHQVRTSMVSQGKSQITGSMPIIATCVAMCPLFGLLGTVTGMIEVFRAMAVQGGNARSMAAGVSAATIPTMSGMIASLSGMVGTTYLTRKIDTESRRFEDSLLLDH